MKAAYTWISKSIIDILSDEIVDRESIDTFALYLKLAILKSYYIAAAGSKSRLFKLLSELIKDKSAFEDESGTYFDDNKPIFIEILSDVWCDSHSTDTMWLTDWKNVCEKIFEGCEENEKTCFDLLDVVNDQLQIMESTNLFLNYAISEILQTEQDILAYVAPPVMVSNFGLQ